MKKIVMGLMLAGSLAIAGSFAQIGAGYSKGDNDGDMATAFAGVNVLSNIGLRLEYTKNISEHPEFTKEDISRYGLFATYTLPLTPLFSITPKAGFAKVDGDFTVKDTLAKISDKSTEFTYGLEVNYQYNELMSFFVGYTDYGHKLDALTTENMDTQNYIFGIKLDL